MDKLNGSKKVCSRRSTGRLKTHGLQDRVLMFGKEMIFEEEN